MERTLNGVKRYMASLPMAVGAMVLFFGIVVPPCDQANGAPPEGKRAKTENVDEHSQDLPVVPSVKDIKKMSVELYNHPLVYDDVPQTEIPREHYEKVLSWFDIDFYAVSDRNTERDELGSIKFILNNNRVVRLSWFDMHNSALSFCINGFRVKNKRSRKKNDGVAFDLYFRKTLGLIKEKME